tara:strand:- start:61 stop:1854 length:1794 start_codon:yes stop_codon:yes gene_type:complete
MDSITLGNVNLELRTNCNSFHTLEDLIENLRHYRRNHYYQFLTNIKSISTLQFDISNNQITISIDPKDITSNIIDIFSYLWGASWMYLKRLFKPWIVTDIKKVRMSTMRSNLSSKQKLSWITKVYSDDKTMLQFNDDIYISTISSSVYHIPHKPQSTIILEDFMHRDFIYSKLSKSISSTNGIHIIHCDRLSIPFWFHMIKQSNKLVWTTNNISITKKNCIIIVPHNVDSPTIECNIRIIDRPFACSKLFNFTSKKRWIITPTLFTQNQLTCSKIDYLFKLLFPSSQCLSNKEKYSMKLASIMPYLLFTSRAQYPELLIHYEHVPSTPLWEQMYKTSLLHVPKLTFNNIFKQMYEFENYCEFNLEYSNDIDQSGECGICLETITNVTKLPCGHIFCLDCIQQVYPTTCPYCRIEYNLFNCTVSANSKPIDLGYCPRFEWATQIIADSKSKVIVYSTFPSRLSTFYVILQNMGWSAVYYGNSNLSGILTQYKKIMSMDEGVILLDSTALQSGISFSEVSTILSLERVFSSEYERSILNLGHHDEFINMYYANVHNSFDSLCGPNGCLISKNSHGGSKNDRTTRHRRTRIEHLANQLIT